MVILLFIGNLRSNSTLLPAPLHWSPPLSPPPPPPPHLVGLLLHLFSLFTRRFPWHWSWSANIVLKTSLLPWIIYFFSTTEPGPQKWKLNNKTSYCFINETGGATMCCWWVYWCGGGWKLRGANLRGEQCWNRNISFTVLCCLEPIISTSLSMCQFTHVPISH